MTSISELIRKERATRKNSRVATACRVVEQNTRAFPVAEAGQSDFTGFRFLSVKTTQTSAQLAWTWAGNGTRYLVFAQEIYGVYFTERSRFELVGLEPRKTYHVFVLAEGRGPEWIAFTSFETLNRPRQAANAGSSTSLEKEIHEGRTALSDYHDFRTIN